MADTKKAVLERLFAGHGSALRAFFHRRVRRHANGADLAQKVYLRLLRAPQLETVRSPEAYLYTVASNLAKEYAIEGQGIPAISRIQPFRTGSPSARISTPSSTGTNARSGCAGCWSNCP